VASGDGQAETEKGRGGGGQRLPLAAASVRLRGRPGRPPREDAARARPAGAPPRRAGAAPGAGPAPSWSTPGRVSLAPLHPRVLDLHGAAAYLGLRERKLRELARSGILPRVRIPLPHDGEVRKLLFDRVDLDRLIEAWKERREIGEA
jgi:Helix-turn-helix domain